MVEEQDMSGHGWAFTVANTGWILLGTGFSFTIGWYATQYYKAVNEPLPDPALQEHINLTAVYDEYAPHFDQDVDRTEYWNGIMSLRSRLVKQAKGRRPFVLGQDPQGFRIEVLLR